MLFNPDNPLIVQGDGSLLLEVKNDFYAGARDFLARFAELEKSPEHIHTYRITSLSLWNAAGAGLKGREIEEGLKKYSKYEVPQGVVDESHLDGVLVALTVDQDDVQVLERPVKGEVDRLEVAPTRCRLRRLFGPALDQGGPDFGVRLGQGDRRDVPRRPRPGEPVCAVDDSCGAA